MSFGFPVGDFIAAANLASEITSCLGEARGAGAEYRSIRELLHLVSQTVQRAENISGPDLDCVKSAVLACVKTVTQCLERIQKYDQSLGEGRLSGHRLQDAARKVSFHFSKKENVRRVKADLVVQLQCLQERLASHCHRESMRQQTDTAAEFARKQRATDGMIAGVSLDLEAQRAISGENRSILRRLVDAVNQNVMHSVIGLETMLSNISNSQQATIQAVAQNCADTRDVRDLVLSIDTRFTYFQAPAKLDDALGRTFPVPSEYSYGLLRVIIEHKVKNSPGRSHVQRGEYEVYNARRPTEFISDAEDMQILPGMQLTIAVIITQERGVVNELCPVPSCSSRIAIRLPCGARRCTGCDIKFGVITKKHRFTTTRDANESESVPEQGSGFMRGPGSNCDEDGIEKLRNVKLHELKLPRALLCSSPDCRKVFPTLLSRYRHEAVIHGIGHVLPAGQ